MFSKIFRIHKILALIFLLSNYNAEYVLDFYDEFDYDCVDFNTWTVNEFYNETLIDDKCYKFTVGNETTKEFYSPNYPNQYPDNIDCNLTIKAPTGYSIKIEFLDTFHLEQATECKYDSLEIYNGRNTSSSLLRKLCSNVLPGEALSSGQYLFLRFKSDASNTYGGFRAKYSFIGNNGISSVDYVSQQNGHLILKVNQNNVQYIGSHVTNLVNRWSEGLFEINALLPAVENINVTIELISTNFRINFLKYYSENLTHEFKTGVLSNDKSNKDNRFSEIPLKVDAKLFKARAYNKFSLEWIRDEQLIWRINSQLLYQQNITDLDLSKSSYWLSITLRAAQLIKKVNNCMSHLHIDYVRVYKFHNNEIAVDSDVNDEMITSNHTLSVSDTKTDTYFEYFGNFTEKNITNVDIAINMLLTESEKNHTQISSNSDYGLTIKFSFRFYLLIAVLLLIFI